MIRISALAKRFRALFPVLALAGFFLPRNTPAESPLSELFQRGKTESKLGSYQASLATFQKLDELSRQPGNEAVRAKLEPLIAFYRGVNHAALGEKETARLDFQTYLSSFPAAHLDPAAFPRSVIDVFNAARDEVKPAEGKDRRRPSGESPIAADYARFHTDPNHPEVADGKWAEGAIRFLMTRQERAAWERATEPAERAEFVTAFWRRRDPSPETPENEFREEIEKRLAFADARFTIGEEKGSATDRGMVFVLLGPPSYIGQTPLKSEDDSLQAARAAPLREFSTTTRRTAYQYIPRDPLSAEVIQGTREIWHYRRDRLPAAVRFNELDFEFTTKKGYGTAVLQRDQQILLALEAAARALSSPD
jgi:GWxTD domain-containing protein